MAYSEEHKTKKIDEICDRISNGESLRSVLNSTGMPSLKMFFEWIKKDDHKRNQYAIATEMRADLMGEEILTIADYSANDTQIIFRGDRPVEVENKEWVNRSRLRVDTRKWLMSKMFPKKYGEKIDFTSQGDKVGTTTVIKWGENEIKI